MTGPDEPEAEPAPTAPHAPLDIREEWDPDAVAPAAASHADTTVEQPAVVPPRHDDELPKRKVRGIARGVNIRSDLQQQQEKLTFRVDRYDIGGNRLTPVPVEMRRYRGGIVT